MTTTTAEAYDAFTGPEFDTTKWMFLQYPTPDKEPWICREPRSQITVADGRLAVEIDRFELAHPVQIIDNCKFVMLSTESFPVPEQSRLLVSAEISGTGIGTTPFAWQEGFASLIVIDPSTGLVFDIVATADSVGAIHERLPFSEEVPPFTHLVQSPLAGVSVRPDATYSCEIALDRAAQTVTWHVDGNEVFRAEGIEVPAAINLGMGIFTLAPVADGESRSLRGQGFKASWSNISVSLS